MGPENVSGYKYVNGFFYDGKYFIQLLVYINFSSSFFILSQKKTKIINHIQDMINESFIHVTGKSELDWTLKLS